MGVQISEIVPRKEIQLKDLKGQIIAIDAYNALYQFLTTIRQVDGTPLQDSKGNITSHLSGLFYRNINLLLEGIKPVYVFDGKPPELKRKENEKRNELKKQAQEKYESAKSEQNLESMRKYSQQFVRITKEIIHESKDLLTALGIPVIEAPGEGEAEASALTKAKKAWATASQDYDVLLYGAPRLIRNLTLSRRRKTSSGTYVPVEIELIEFESLLNHLQIDQDQLICLGILVGTDYNIGGIKGLGQKRALEIVKKYKYPVTIFKYLQESDKYKDSMNFNWQDIFKEFKDYQHNGGKMEFKKPDEKKVREILLSKDFSLDRIDSGLKRLEQANEEQKQKGLQDFW